jgi:hypothetical protein
MTTTDLWRGGTVLKALATLGTLRAPTSAGLPQVTLCGRCEQTVFTTLGALFRHRGQPPTLEGSRVMGLTFSAGPVATCALHPFLDRE